MMTRLLRTFLLGLCLMAPLLASAADLVKWTASIPADAKPGAATTVTLTGKVVPGNHLYSLTKPKGTGPTPTTIEAVAPLKISGKIDQSTPLKRIDPNFQVEVEYYGDTATFTVPVTLGPDPKKDKLSVHFQTCDDRACAFPKTVEVPLSGAEAKVVVEQGDVANARAKGLLPFLGFAFLSGLIALLTPCVFPMVPITVSFFSKRRENMGAKTGLLHAGAYCFGIIGAYTAFGILVTVLFGASGIQNFAANPYVNLVLAIIFVLLALNLFGLLEVSLPSKLTNAFSPHSKSGLLAPFLMGLTFTLTSFTCTGPFVGTVLVSAANGDLIYPLVGMLAFSTAFALPFFLLALFPQYLARLPKSGSWLEVVKAFMGFLEVAAAVKFVSNADLVWGTGLISRTTFLLIWAAIFGGSVLFLLRVIRLPKIEVPAKLGRGRAVTAILTSLLAVWMLVGATGKSLGDLEAFLPPGASDGWSENYERSLQVAKRDNKPLLIDFTGVTCTNCRWMERNMFPRPEVAQELKNYVLTKLYTDRPSDKANQDLMLKLTQKVTMPIYVVMSPKGDVLRIFEGSTPDVQKYLKFLSPNPSKVALNR
ncbi:protein-disulfide reductase DsbD family protein [Fimbriimonas ginsengisoli]|uniref:Cytochrome c biogenesis protein transmembrane region n=1 Tax=Fimbriimonas ginsengisoli Gsoil 348 TaxID=661478 RepID=A0A068NX74_FIMGI|nr:cytochrome c biogenesis protein CcdA [Fimbriimonas ginsengisoli]AIE88098.1 cytochrome c biogenesis protein transmembrane region [Fimbriimonas ginsengisoli Gsoil 348]